MFVMGHFGLHVFFSCALGTLYAFRDFPELNLCSYFRLASSSALIGSEVELGLRVFSMPFAENFFYLVYNTSRPEHLPCGEFAHTGRGPVALLSDPCAANAWLAVTTTTLLP